MRWTPFTIICTIVFGIIFAVSIGIGASDINQCLSDVRTISLGVWHIVFGSVGLVAIILTLLASFCWKPFHFFEYILVAFLASGWLIVGTVLALIPNGSCTDLNYTWRIVALTFLYLYALFYAYEIFYEADYSRIVDNSKGTQSYAKKRLANENRSNKSSFVF